MTRRLLTVGLTLAAVSLCGCIMVNSSTTLTTRAAINYRSPATEINGSSNSLTNANASEGGGKVDAQIPLTGK